MKKITFATFLAVIMFVFTAPALAQAKVYLAATAKDNVGGQLAYQIRENMRGSRGMNLVFSEDDAVIHLRLVTLDPDDDGRQTVYSAVWTVRQLDNKDAHLYWTSSVGICGASRVRQCADNLTAKTDKVVTEVQEIIRNIMKKSSY